MPQGRQQKQRQKGKEERGISGRKGDLADCGNSQIARGLSADSVVCLFERLGLWEA